jgi:hypothetical protein
MMRTRTLRAELLSNAIAAVGVLAAVLLAAAILTTVLAYWP